MIILFIILGIVLAFILLQKIFVALGFALGVTSYGIYGVFKVIKTICSFKTEGEYYINHIKWLFVGFFLLLLGILITPLILVGMICIIAGIVCTIKNMKRIKEEQLIRKENGIKVKISK